MANHQFLLFRHQQIRQVEQSAMRDLNLSEYELMQRAGQAAFEELVRRWPKLAHCIVVCGGGNNAGDGYQLAHLACRAGYSVKIYYLVEPEKLTGAAAQAYGCCQQDKVSMESFPKTLPQLDAVYVDALLGTGLKGEVRENYQQAIAQLNKLHQPVLALDVPSGLDADTGVSQGCTIQADVTVTFIGLKPGLFTQDGAQYAGDIVLNTLDLPEKIYPKPCAQLLPGEALTHQLLTSRTRNSYKNNFGHILIVGGDEGMAGSVAMAGVAALRVGAGLVSVATHPNNRLIVNSQAPELMVHGIESSEQLQALMAKASVIVLGPGLGQREWGLRCFNQVISSDKPMVIDADGLNWLAQQPRKSSHSILTPHPGEAKTLLQHQWGDDRLDNARNLVGLYGGVAVLKGAGTVIAAQDELTSVATVGNPGMATAGMGDILSGIIAGLLGQGASLWQAANLGVYLHGKAGDLCAALAGERGMIATDLLSYLPQLVNL